MNDFSKPLLLHECSVRREWIDEYDHMNLSFYVWVCDQASYEFWEVVNEGVSISEREGAEYAVVETHVNYLREVRLNDPLKVTTQLVAYDEKRFRIFHELYHATQGYLAATNEIMALGFNTNQRKISAFRTPVVKMLEQIYEQHHQLPLPANAGRAIQFGQKTSDTADKV